MDMAKAQAGRPIPLYDRPLTVELWYPALKGTGLIGQITYPGVCTRDGMTLADLHGRAVRDALPDRSAGPCPLVIISHGYPGNRFLLSHFAENLASKGYAVASIDHTDSTYENQGAFGSTLLNRPLDILFVLDVLSKLQPGSGLEGMIDTERTAVIGYSMGGYGAINALGGGLSEAIVKTSAPPLDSALSRRQDGSPEFLASLDPRIKAAIAIAPWGWNKGYWDAKGLEGIRTPVFFMAGSADPISGYSPGIRDIFELAVNAERYLLTFENAGHNAAAPIPAPGETYAPPGATVYNAGHYMDPVWDTVRMNNIAQHFATAFFAKHLKGDPKADAYLNLVEWGREAVWSMEAAGKPAADHNYWKGFGRFGAVGLRMEHRSP